MSSINKSGTRFVPKIKQRKKTPLANLKKPSGSKKPSTVQKKPELSTPPSTQVSTQPKTPNSKQKDSENDQTKDNDPSEKQNDDTGKTTAGIMTPQSTQLPVLTQPGSPKSQAQVEPARPATPPPTQTQSQPKSTAASPKAGTSIEIPAIPTLSTSTSPQTTTAKVTPTPIATIPTIARPRTRRDSVDTIASSTRPALSLSQISTAGGASSTSSRDPVVSGALQRQRRLPSLANTGTGSLIGGRRRSSITASSAKTNVGGPPPPIFGLRSRRGSTASVFESESEAGDPAPVRIGIPVGAPAKRRRSSAAGGPIKRRRRRSSAASNVAGSEAKHVAKSVSFKETSFKEPSSIGIPKKSKSIAPTSSSSASSRGTSNSSTISAPTSALKSSTISAPTESQSHSIAPIPENRNVTDPIPRELTEEERKTLTIYYKDPVKEKLVKLESEDIRELELVPSNTKVIDNIKELTLVRNI
ncbi:unnamed protein product [Ambrosiozyma monospora]|uniref:Unnamed protein product n=1 Tax=Ambrosiozyma monospora TaxID=43982 RepID=A0ACB5T6D2_AMBMO|nr:unnamed protein product [Ambrosiozyma monospora]